MAPWRDDGVLVCRLPHSCPLASLLFSISVAELEKARKKKSAVQINLVNGCVSAVLIHETFDHVYLDNRVEEEDEEVGYWRVSERGKEGRKEGRCADFPVTFLHLSLSLSLCLGTFVV